MRAEVAAAVPASRSPTTALGTPALDLRAGVRAAAARAGRRRVDRSRPAPPRSPDLFSYRRDGTTGRFAGVVWLRVRTAADRVERARRELAGEPGRGARRASPRPAARPAATRTRSRWSPSPRPARPPTCGCWPGWGSRDVGENRDQEAAAKAAECADLGAALALRRPAADQQGASVARYADVVHSVDRRAAGRRAVRGGRRARPGAGDCLVQVEPRRDGADAAGAGRGARPGACPRSPPRSAAAERPRAARLMAVAPLGADPAEAFARLRRGSPPAAPRRTRTPTGVGRDERRPRGGGRARRDTRACRQRALLGDRPPLR